jgi:hypothetical protein
MDLYFIVLAGVAHIGGDSAINHAQEAQGLYKIGQGTFDVNGGVGRRGTRTFRGVVGSLVVPQRTHRSLGVGVCERECQCSPCH